MILAVSLAAAGTPACGGSSSPSPIGGSNTCRTYPTAASVTTTTSGFTQNALLTGAFNASTNQSTVTTQFASGAPCTTTVNSYRSTADFVDEVRVIPPVSLQTSTSTTNAGACGSGTSNVSYAYDGQRRLTSFTSGGSTTTYTAWDSSGRPTAGSFPGTSIANVYNDSARTLTQTQTSGSATSVTTTTYDANGTNVMIVNTSGSVVSTTTITVTSTAQVCK
jgi:YD repeat-containing protein